MIADSCRWVLLIACIAGLGRTAVAQDQPDSGSGQVLVELNRAIRAYLEEERDTATEIFERLLLESDPTAEYRVTCHYYLGLIALERGLYYSSAAQDATRAAETAQAEAQEAAEAGRSEEAEQAQKAVEAAQREAAAAAVTAREHFEKAQEHLGEVVLVADPTAEMINAALLLGVAQLASDYPGAEEEAPFRLARRAEQTLHRYVTETELGRHDRYGQFYLAVTRYRLADEYRGQRGRGREFAESLAAATHNLEEALHLAEADFASGRLSPEGHEGFKTVVAYYDALLAILQRDNVGARALFTEVTERAAGTDLAQNAQAIIAKLDEVETAHPLPIQLDVPGPIGPLEFDGRIRIGNWYDSNVILLGKDTTLPRGFKRKDDYRYGISAEFNISRYISKTEAPWVGESLTLGVGGGTLNVWQPNIPQFDVNRYPARAFVNWQPIRDLYLGAQYEYSYTQLGHDPFISSQRITPVISKTWRSRDGTDTDLGRTDLYYTHDERNYLDILTNYQLNRDGQYDAVGVQHTFHLIQAQDLPYLAEYFDSHERERELFGDDWLSFYIGYDYRDERTVGTEFDLRGHSLLCGLDVPLPYRFAFELDSEFTWADYGSPSLFDFERKDRADFVQRYRFALTYAFIAPGEYVSMRTLDVKLRTGIELTFQDSNIWNRLGEDIYEYDRAVYGVQLEVDF